jgi:deoxyadenosine/deoxycytidine kinase
MTVKSCRKVIITGGVAVGKSSIVSVVCEELTRSNTNWKFIPEYIDAEEDGLEMLNKYLRGDITVYEFQNYVINFYEWYLNEITLRGDEILIFERSVDDSVTCFSNMDNKKGKLNTEDFLKLYEEAKRIDVEYNIPSYLLSNDFVFIPIKTVDIQRDGKLIAEIVKNRIDENIVIGLYNSDEQCYKRMCERDRPGEKDSYTRESISNFNYHYKQLYKELMVGEEIRFASLGKLIR